MGRSYVSNWESCALLPPQELEVGEKGQEEKMRELEERLREGSEQSQQLRQETEELRISLQQQQEMKHSAEDKLKEVCVHCICMTIVHVVVS